MKNVKGRKGVRKGKVRKEGKQTKKQFILRQNQQMKHGTLPLQRPYGASVHDANKSKFKVHITSASNASHVKSY